MIVQDDLTKCTKYRHGIRAQITVIRKELYLVKTLPNRILDSRKILTLPAKRVSFRISAIYRQESDMERFVTHLKEKFGAGLFVVIPLGITLFINQNEVLESGMNVEEAVKFVVSGGMVAV